MPARWLAALTALSLPLAAAAAAQVAPPEETPQALFREVILADPKTKVAIQRLLRTNAGFVAPKPKFADLTGDGRMDAIAAVQNGGAAGTVAVYVLSAHGEADGPLRVVYRSQSLYRAVMRVAGRTLTIAVPRYAPGDDVCCPAELFERDYAWEEAPRAFTRRAARTVRGPGTPASNG